MVITWYARVGVRERVGNPDMVVCATVTAHP
jgi:hypothetical protein